MRARSSPTRPADRRDSRRWVAAGALCVGLVVGSACASDDGTPELERIDGPAHVDQERLDGGPGAVNDGESGG